MSTKALESLRIEIDSFCENFGLDHKFKPHKHETPKIIHDTIWGTIRLEPWEICFIDLPLFQRLRQIRQTSLVDYVFPGCSHTRFEHTLGVLHQTQELVDVVNSQDTSGHPPFDLAAIRDMRLAALFHDVGHSCFSHISENVYQHCADMEEITSDSGDFPGYHPHELLSYLVLISRPVKNYLRELETSYKNIGLKFDEERAGKWIVGQPEDPDKKLLYRAQVINGPFDADKLDYLFRDSHYSGLPLSVDLDRLWTSCKVETHPETGKQILTLHQSCATPLEQILFNKINLFTVVYQHPKVRAAECLFEGAIEHVINRGLTIQGKDLKKSADYLWLTDALFFMLAHQSDNKDEELKQMVHEILYRRVLVRALTISSDTVENNGSSYQEIRRLTHRSLPASIERRTLARKIWQNAGKPCSIEHIWVDLPADPPVGGADQTYVRTNSGKLRKLSELFPVHYWSALYVNYKWRGHVFCPFDCQQQIYESAKTVINDEYKLQFNKYAGETAHVPHP